MLSLPAAISAAKQRSQKVLLLRKSNLNFGQNGKSWGGPSSFYGSKLGYGDCACFYWFWDTCDPHTPLPNMSNKIDKFKNTRISGI